MTFPKYKKVNIYNNFYDNSSLKNKEVLQMDLIIKKLCAQIYICLNLKNWINVLDDHILKFINYYFYY